jgi:hypothetical protein
VRLDTVGAAPIFTPMSVMRDPRRLSRADLSFRPFEPCLPRPAKEPNRLPARLCAVELPQAERAFHLSRNDPDVIADELNQAVKVVESVGKQRVGGNRLVHRRLGRTTAGGNGAMTRSDSGQYR